MLLAPRWAVLCHSGPVAVELIQSPVIRRLPGVRRGVGPTAHLRLVDSDEEQTEPGSKQEQGATDGQGEDAQADG